MSDQYAKPSIFKQVLAHENRANPYPFYAQLRIAPVSREDDGSYVVSSFDSVSTLLRDPRLSSDPEKSGRDGFKLSILNMDPPEHDRIRRIVMRCLLSGDRQGGFAGMVPQLRGIVSELVDRLAERSEIDIVADVAYPFPVTVVTDLLGVPRSEEPKFRVWADAIVQATDRDPRDIGAASEGAQRAIADLGGYLFQLMQARRSDPKDDLLSRLVHYSGPDGSMTPPDLTALAILLLLAGHETTVNLISNGMLTLLRKPDLLAAFTADPELAGAFVEETLRYEPPVHITIRTALEDIEVGGSVIPQGSTVHLLLASANRDGRRFSEPDEFVIARTNNKHLAFGGGIHNCLGAPLARLEGQIALQELVKRLRNPRLLQDPPAYRINPSLRGPKQIRVAVDGIR